MNPTSANTPRKSSNTVFSHTPSKSKTPITDRFIPNRSAMDSEVASFSLENTDTNDNHSSTPSKDCYRTGVAQSLLGDQSSAPRILTLQASAPPPPEGYINSMKVLYSQNKISDYQRVKSTRHIPTAPEKILDCPDIVDDYYLNLIDWGSNNILSVALADTVYLWNAATGSISELMKTQSPDDIITSVSWAQEGNYLAVGTNNSVVQIWDCEAKRQVRTMRGHRARVGSLAWNGPVLASGSRDSMILNHDVRIADHVINKMEAHTHEVCGLKWSLNGQQLASGGNDNKLCIWDVGQSTPRFDIQHHCAAVKALAWSPHQSNLLASGGGVADRKICFWNTQTGAMLQEVDTNSQVCSLQWNKHEKEILSSHGFSQNQLTLWKYPSMVRVQDLTGHTQRVLHMAQSPDGTTVVSAAADESLRFWRVFGENGTKKQAARAPSSSGMSASSIR